jgi:hypothetical protein
MKEKLRKGMAKCLLPFVFAGSVGLGGCATMNGTGQNTQNEIGYEKFYDSYGDYKLVGRNNDIYLEKIDGSESKQITHTPHIVEIEAQFSVNGKYIVYETQDLFFISPIFKFYRVPINRDDTNRQEISKKEAQALTPSLFY